MVQIQSIKMYIQFQFKDINFRSVQLFRKILIAHNEKGMHCAINWRPYCEGYICSENFTNTSSSRKIYKALPDVYYAHFQSVYVFIRSEGTSTSPVIPCIVTKIVTLSVHCNFSISPQNWVYFALQLRFVSGKPAEIWDQDRIPSLLLPATLQSTGAFFHSNYSGGF